MAGALEGVFVLEIGVTSGEFGIQFPLAEGGKLGLLDGCDRHLLEGILAARIVVRSGRGHAGAVGSERGVFPIEAVYVHRFRVDSHVI